jgi:hypothetical protein
MKLFFHAPPLIIAPMLKMDVLDNIVQIFATVKTRGGSMEAFALRVVACFYFGAEYTIIMRRWSGNAVPAAFFGRGGTVFPWPTVREQ